LNRANNSLLDFLSNIFYHIILAFNPLILPHLSHLQSPLKYPFQATKKEALEEAHQAALENEKLRRTVRELRVLVDASQGVYEGTVKQARSAQGQRGDSSSVTPSASETPPSFISRVTAGSGTRTGAGTGTGAGTSAGAGTEAGAERAFLSHLRGRLSSTGAPPTLDELSCQLFERELELSEKQVRDCLRSRITRVRTYGILDVQAAWVSGLHALNLYYAMKTYGMSYRACSIDNEVYI
jgi:hypothetical protein